MRTLGAQPGADFRLRPEADTLEMVLRRIAPDFVPDLILVWTPENDPPPLGMEHSPVPTVCLAGDWNLFHAAQARGYGRYDVVLSDRPGLAVLRNDVVQPHFWQPLYAHNPLLHRAAPVERDIDVLYIGNLNLGHRTERAPRLHAIATLPPERRVVITTDVWGEEYTRLHQRARIVFNHAVRGELNLRTFETMACGALAFLEDSNAEVRDFFTDGVDIVLYNEGNLRDKIAFYLDHPSEAEAIAQRGQARVAAFAGVARLDSLVEFALAQPHSGRPFLQLDPRERDIEDYLMVTVSQRAEYGPLERRLAAELVERYPDDARAWSARGRSLCYYRDRRTAALTARECLQFFRRAIELDEDSAVHALNAAYAAQLQGLDKAMEAFARIALRAKHADPADFLWGLWQNPFWTRWLRAQAEGTTSLAALHAEAHALLGALAERTGGPRAALAHYNLANTLDPGHPGYAMPEAQSLIDTGKLEPAVAAAERALAESPLHAALVKSVGELHAALGNRARAATLEQDAALIKSRTIVPWPVPIVCKGHAATREEATEPPTARQERALRNGAKSTGAYAGLLWFLAAQGRLDEIAALAPLIAPETREDFALVRLFSAEEITPADGLALIEGLPSSPLFHLLLKRCLRNDDLAGAWSVIDAASDAVPQEVSCLNLLARYLSLHSNSVVHAAVERSLAIAPRQEDIAALLESPFDGTLYLEAAPKCIPVSFYLPAFNVGRYIRETLEAVFRQDFPLLEVFVVNDGSQDDSIAMAREFPVRILHHDRNRGLAAARNTALREARGAWLLTVDTDARPEADFVRRAVMELETCDPGVAAIGGVLEEAFQEDPADRWRAHMMAQHHGPVRQCPPWFLFGSTMGIERATALAVGGYDEAHRTNGEDTELGKALARAGKRLLYTPGMRAHHQRRDDVHSVLKTWWNWHYWVKVEANAWRIVGGLVDGMQHNLAQAAAALQRFVDADERRLWYITYLFVYYDPLLDLRHAAQSGLLAQGEAKTLAGQILARANALDTRLEGSVAQAIVRDTAAATSAWDHIEEAPISPGMAQEFVRYFGALDGLLESLPEQIYGGIAEFSGLD